MEEKKNPQGVELNDTQLDQVSGGAINVYDAPGSRQLYYKYTCRACGMVGVVADYPAACCTCKSTNIVCEEYKPLGS